MYVCIHIYIYIPTSPTMRASNTHTRVYYTILCYASTNTDTDTDTNTNASANAYPYTSTYSNTYTILSSILHTKTRPPPRS